MNSATIKNPVFKVEWAGWLSDTLTLQQNGWELSAEQDVARYSIRFAMRNPRLRIYGISQMINGFDYHDFGNPMRHVNSLPIVRVEWMTSRFEVIVPMDLATFAPIDAVPMYMDNNQKKSIEDFKIFRPLNAVNEIVIVKENVPELLDKIMKLQDPKQKEIREKKRRSDREFLRMTEGMDLEGIKSLANEENSLVAQVIAVA